MAWQITDGLKVERARAVIASKNVVRYIEFSAPEILSNFSEFPVTSSQRAVTSNSSGRELQNNLRQPDSLGREGRQHEICCFYQQGKVETNSLRCISASSDGCPTTNHLLEKLFPVKISTPSPLPTLHYLRIAQELRRNCAAFAQLLLGNWPTTDWFTKKREETKKNLVGKLTHYWFTKQ